ncbi:hypothetical protein FB567DRAFT_540609 [Paraphoma chrysanthemicola]|uniref:Uncharacterized protein n=1 Tax=Paraphoma chrysanthemicola TaxID=798071 RepID=A0A8K0VRL0_9PLEO|nr:hypothetical protein FB567DRAFT_540609 [Paraphoma chrysanthemicola]
MLVFNRLRIVVNRLSVMGSPYPPTPTSSRVNVRPLKVSFLSCYALLEAYKWSPYQDCQRLRCCLDSHQTCSKFHASYTARWHVSEGWGLFPQWLACWRDGPLRLLDATKGSCPRKWTRRILTTKSYRGIKTFDFNQDFQTSKPYIAVMFGDDVHATIQFVGPRCGIRLQIFNSPTDRRLRSPVSPFSKRKEVMIDMVTSLVQAI